VLSNRFEELGNRAHSLCSGVNEPQSGQMNLHSIDEILGKDAAPLLSIFLCIPFLFPVPLPGLSTAFGFAIIFLALRGMFSRRPKLPEFIGKREISAQSVEKICFNAKRTLLKIERYVHSRFGFVSTRFAQILSCLAIISSSLALAVPVPPVIPFTNFFPAFAILLLCVAELEEDGLVAIVGHIMHFVSWGYLILIGGAAFAVFEKVFAYLKPFFPSLGTP
jgi:hypothetical protein